MKTHCSDFRLTFGNYRGSTLGAVYKIDRSYVLWLRDDTQGPAQKAAEEFIRQENMRIILEGQRK